MLLVWWHYHPPLQLTLPAQQPFLPSTSGTILSMFENSLQITPLSPTSLPSHLFLIYPLHLPYPWQISPPVPVPSWSNSLWPPLLDPPPRQAKNQRIPILIPAFCPSFSLNFFLHVFPIKFLFSFCLFLSLFDEIFLPNFLNPIPSIILPNHFLFYPSRDKLTTTMKLINDK